MSKICTRTKSKSRITLILKPYQQYHKMRIWIYKMRIWIYTTFAFSTKLSPHKFTASMDSWVTNWCRSKYSLKNLHKNSKTQVFNLPTKTRLEQPIDYIDNLISTPWRIPLEARITVQNEWTSQKIKHVIWSEGTNQGLCIKHKSHSCCLKERNQKSHQDVRARRPV